MGKKYKMKASDRLVFILILISILFAMLYIIAAWIMEHIWQTILIFIAIIGIIALILWKIPSLKDYLWNYFQKRFRIYSNVNDEEIKPLISIIKEMQVQDVRNEEDFEKQLYQRIEAKGYKVERQVSVGSSRKIDMMVNGKIGIELKIADKSKNVQDLISQITIYNKYIEKIIVVILDVGIKIDNECINLIRDINPNKISVIIITGNLKRYKKKEEYITVKKTTSKY